MSVTVIAMMLYICSLPGGRTWAHLNRLGICHTGVALLLTPFRCMLMTMIAMMLYICSLPGGRTRADLKRLGICHTGVALFTYTFQVHVNDNDSNDAVHLQSARWQN